MEGSTGVIKKWLPGLRGKFRFVIDVNEIFWGLV